jgi:hypothetical protein
LTHGEGERAAVGSCDLFVLRVGVNWIRIRQTEIGGHIFDAATLRVSSHRSGSSHGYGAILNLTRSGSQLITARPGI